MRHCMFIFTGSRALILLLMIILGMTVVPLFASSENILLEAKGLKLVLTKTTDASGEGIMLTSLKNENGLEYFPPIPHPIFRVVLRETTTKKVYDATTVSGWESIKVQRGQNVKGENELTITLANPRCCPIKQSATVTVHMTASQENPEIRMSWEGTTANSETSFWRGKFPLVSFRPLSDDMTGIYPSHSGCVRRDIFTDSFKYRGTYPSGFSATMSWIAYWDNKTNNGLYVGIHDPWGSVREIGWLGKTKQNMSTFYADIPFENMGVPGNKLNSTGEVVFRAFKGNWYEASLLYRDWVSHNAKWWPEMGPEGRKDIPLWMKENGVFLMMSTDQRWLTPSRRVYTPLNKMAETTGAFQSAVGVPGAVHWYLWHQNVYDNDYPHFFPAKEGFAEEVLKLQKDNLFRAMPYTNGRLWDTHDRGKEDWKFTRQGLPGATKKEDGSIYSEQYPLEHTGRESDGTPCVHALMCPATKVWQDRVRENVLTAMNGHNVQAVYIDQIGAATPLLCFDKTHGHPVGGGHWWLDQGQWKSLSRIRHDMRREVPDYPLTPEQKELFKKNPEHLKNRIITTECNAEVYAAVVDGFLTWHWQQPNQVPAFVVVYGGVIPFIGRASVGDALALRARVAEALTNGEQIGWFDANVKDDPEKFNFIRNTLRFRYQVRSYFYKGRMGRQPKFLDPIPKITSDWVWYNNTNLHIEDAVRTSLWRITDYDLAQKGVDKTKSALLIFSNYSKKEVVSRIQFDWKELGFKPNECSIRKINSEGISKEKFVVESLNAPLTFPPETSWGIELIENNK